MYTDHNGVSYETQEDRYPQGFHSSGEDKTTDCYDRCPKCSSDNTVLDSGPDFISSTEITVTMICLDCDAEWLAVYDIKRKRVEFVDADYEDEDEDDD